MESPELQNSQIINNENSNVMVEGVDMSGSEGQMHPMDSQQQGTEYIMESNAEYEDHQGMEEHEYGEEGQDQNDVEYREEMEGVERLEAMQDNEEYNIEEEGEGEEGELEEQEELDEQEEVADQMENYSGHPEEFPGQMSQEKSQNLATESRISHQVDYPEESYQSAQKKISYDVK